MGRPAKPPTDREDLVSITFNCSREERDAFKAFTAVKTKRQQDVLRMLVNRWLRESGWQRGSDLTVAQSATA